MIKEGSLISALRGQIMLTNSKIALSLALVLATASATMAAPKHIAMIQQQIPANTYLIIGSVHSTGPLRSTGPANQPSSISPRGFERLEHLLKAFDAIGLEEDLGN